MNTALLILRTVDLFNSVNTRHFTPHIAVVAFSVDIGAFVIALNQISSFFLIL